MSPPPVRAAKESPQRAWTRALEVTTRATRDPARTLPRAVAEWAERYGDRPALIGDEETYSFTRLSTRINQYARWALAQDIRKGATVALMMRNRPEYAAIWLGLTRIGAVVALIGPDLQGAALAPCARASPARAWRSLSPEGAAAMRGRGLRGRDLDVRRRRAAARQDRRSLFRRAARDGEAPTSGSTTARCASSPPAPPACRRRRRSAIARSSPGRIGSPASRG